VRPFSRRLTVGVPFSYRADWVGGNYYVRNSLLALQLLPERRRPVVLVIGDRKAFEYLRDESGYPGLCHIRPADIERSPPRRFGGLRWSAPGAGGDIDVVLHGSAPGLEDRAIQWVPDFQEEHFPEFFPPGEVEARHRRNAGWFSKHRHIVVSSQDTRRDLERFYGGYQNRVHVVSFASFVEHDLATADPAALRARYSLPPRFFICNNQLWRHKNHGVILRTLAALAREERVPPVVFTGHEGDYRDSTYGPSVKAQAAELGLADRVRFLGFLPRGDQLGLMSQAIAIIQPSLCEGWSTVVEDAKGLSKHVLASDIAVHREQLDCNVDFFAPHDHVRLADLLRRYGARDPQAGPIDYGRRKVEFARNLLVMLVEAARDFKRRGVDRFCVPRPDLTANAADRAASSHQPDGRHV
jgi:glycosyltransferase involved in cell wall biosynthesis